MRVAIVGSGMIARVHADALTGHPDVELVAIVGESDRARELAGSTGAAHVESVDALYEHPDVDAVSVCTPGGTHAAIAVPLLERGKHLVIEKPLEVTVAAALEIDAAARAAKRTVAVVSQHRFDEASRVIKRSIDAGELGSLTSALVAKPWWRDQSYYDSSAWRGTRRLDGGGALMNQAIHDLDLLLWFMGEPVEVSAASGLLAHERIEVEDTLAGWIRFASGALASLLVTTAARPGLPAQIAVFGDEGSAGLSGDRLAFHLPSRAERSAMVGERPQEGGAASPAIDSGPHRETYSDFTEAVRQGRRPLSSLSDGIRAVRAATALYESARTGRSVSLQDPVAG